MHGWRCRDTRWTTRGPRLLLLLACSASVPAVFAGDDLVAFNASVKVEVDPTGKPVAVEAPADIPAPIAAAIEKRVAGWIYVPAHRGDTPVAAVTYVSVGACAVPAEGGYRLGVDFKGNGPRVHSDTGRLPPPRYPRSLVMRGIGGTFEVSYSVLPDGSTKLKGIESIGKRMKLDYRQAFEDALEDWVESLRYDPEEVDGQAVATQVRFPVMYMVDDDDDRNASNWREQYAARLREQAIQSDECKLASGAATGPIPLAVDSPVKVTPAPPG